MPVGAPRRCAFSENVGGPRDMNSNTRPGVERSRKRAGGFPALETLFGNVGQTSGPTVRTHRRFGPKPAEVEPV